MSVPNAVVVLLLALLASPGFAGVFQVTKTADTFDGVCDDDCSLREAVAMAFFTAPSVILLPPGHYRLVRGGPTDDSVLAGDLDIFRELVILGSGAASTVIDGMGLDRVLDAHGSVRLELLDLTVRGGKSTEGGGGIRTESVLTLQRVVIADNQAGGPGGGISAPIVVASDSTIAGNVSPRGAGIAASVQLTNVTLTGNRGPAGAGTVVGNEGILRNVTIAGNPAGGVVQPQTTCDFPFPCASANTTVEGSIVADNGPPVAGCLGEVDSLGFNLTPAGSACGTHPTDLVAPADLKLGPLADNGGPVPTRSPLPGSPAIDAGGSACGTKDARGASRPADGNGDGSALCDSGATELTAACVASDAALCMQGGRFRVSAAWRTADGAGAAHAARLTNDTGTFWFFSPDNVEITAKLLDGCTFNGHFWAFSSGLTDVEVTITVEDTLTGRTKTYENPLGTPYAPRFDTEAFTCDGSGSITGAGGETVASCHSSSRRYDSSSRSCDSLPVSCDRSADVRQLSDSSVNKTWQATYSAEPRCRG